MSPDERANDVAVLTQYGQNAVDCLKDAKPVLADILEAQSVECTNDELNAVYAGLKEMTCDTSLSQFEKELNTQVGQISQARNRVLLKERWYALSGEETVKEWCKTHSAPLLWILSKEQQKAVETVIDVQNGNRTIDQNVQNAISVLESMDVLMLTNDKVIAEAFLKTVGEEYRSIFEEERDAIIAQAKMQIGNDMSAWGITDLAVLQKILKRALQEKAKKEKLERAKNCADSMDASTLRERVKHFIENHPEFCDSFLD